MKDIIQVEVQTELPLPPTKTLAEQREELRVRLQLNRRILEHKLFDRDQNQFAPRSVTMRFLSNQNTRHIIQRVAGTALGLQAFKSLRYGYSLIQFARSAYSAFKATRNVVKAKEVEPI
jgi:hypothetical protein